MAWFGHMIHDTPRHDRHPLVRSGHTQNYLLAECPVDGACSSCQPGVDGYTCDDTGELYGREVLPATGQVSKPIGHRARKEVRPWNLSVVNIVGSTIIVDVGGSSKSWLFLGAT